MSNPDREKERRDRFLKLAPKRTQKILDRLLILRNCANKSAYLYSRDDVEKIFDALESEVEKTRAAFELKYKKKFRL